MQPEALHVATSAGSIQIVDEPTYTFGSADNKRRYPHEVPMGKAFQPNTAHGVLLNGEPLAVFGDFRCSGVHRRSALAIADRVLLAVGGRVVCFSPEPFQVHWDLDVDDASCFGIHFSADRDALISHGELSIARFSRDGRLLWQSYGAEIFSEGFALKPACIEAIDFNDVRYGLSYDTGKSLP